MRLDAVLGRELALAPGAHRLLLGEAATKFHGELRTFSEQKQNFRVHYVTAREMANLAMAPKSPVGPTEAMKNSPYPKP